MPLDQMTVDYMVALAKADPDREVCGFILENEEVHPILNVSKEPQHQFEMDAHQQLKAIEAASAERLGDKILGMFHSHTSGNPVPSALDMENWPPRGWKYWTIAGYWVMEWEVGEPNGFPEEVWSCEADPERELVTAPARDSIRS